MKYNYIKWDVEQIQDPNILLKKLKELNIKGKKIKAIRTIGYVFNFEMISGTFKDSEIFNRYIEIDTPLIIEFEDHSRFEIDYSEGSTLKIGLNSLPYNIYSEATSNNVDGNIIFSNCLGKTITGYAVEMTDEFGLNWDFTGSYGIELDDNNDLYISRLKIYLTDRLAISFTNYHDYGAVWVNESNDCISLIKWGELKNGVKQCVLLKSIKDCKRSKNQH